MENRRRPRAAWVALLLAVLVLGVANAGWTLPPAQGFRCVLAMDGRQPLAEVFLRLSEDGTSLDYTLKVHGIENITMAHLHLGEAGKIGTPVVWLYPPSPPPKLIPGMFKGVLAEGTITEKDLIGGLRGRKLADLIDEMRDGNIHVNIHSREHLRAGIFAGKIGRRRL